MKLLKTSQYVIMTKCQVIVKTDCIYFHAEPFHLRLSLLLVSIMPFLTYIYYPLYSSNLNTHSGTNSELAITHYIHSPLLMRLVLQTPHQLCCPSLNTPQGLNIFLVVRCPKLHTVLKVQPRQC